MAVLLLEGVDLVPHHGDPAVDAAGSVRIEEVDRHARCPVLAIQQVEITGNLIIDSTAPGRKVREITDAVASGEESTDANTQAVQDVRLRSHWEGKGGSCDQSQTSALPQASPDNAHLRCS